MRKRARDSDVVFDLEIRCFVFKSYQRDSSYSFISSSFHPLRILSSTFVHRRRTVLVHEIIFVNKNTFKVYFNLTFKERCCLPLPKWFTRAHFFVGGDLIALEPIRFA